MEYLVFDGDLNTDQVGRFETHDGRVVKAGDPLSWATGLKFENVAYHCRERGMEVYVCPPDGGMPVKVPYRAPRR